MSQNANMKKRSFKDKCFKDQKGNVVLGQKPNLPLQVAIGSFIFGLFINNSKLAEFITVLGFGSLFVFAWLELFQGVNYIRRAFGFIVLALMLYTSVF